MANNENIDTKNICFTVNEDGERENRLLIFDEVEFKMGEESFDSEDVMEVNVKFRGRGWLFSPVIKGWGEYIIDTIYIHFLEP